MTTSCRFEEFGCNDMSPSTISGDPLNPDDPDHTSTATDNGGGANQTPVASATPILISASATATVSFQTSAPDGSAIATSSAIPAVSSSGGSKGVSKGAVAGIAIATAIIGAAIAFGIAFLLFKRRKRSSGHPYSESTPELVSPLKGKHTPYVQVSQTPAPPPIAAAAVAPANRDLDLANLSNSSDFLAGVLPPGADEQTVKNKVAALFNQIKHHVDTYYRDVHATLTPTMENDLARFGSDTMNIVEMLQNSSMPTAAIKHALAGYILSIVSPEAEDQATLFPTEMSGLKENERSTNTPDDHAAYILYKRLAAHLHSPNPASLQSRQSDIREAAEHFALTFFPWVNPAYNDQEKDDYLVQIISSALDLSVWLYGQPFLYEFVWEGVGSRGTVITPGLVRSTDERGRPLQRPQMLLEPAVVSS